MKAPNEELSSVAMQTASGITDAKWVSEDHFVVATDSGKEDRHKIYCFIFERMKYESNQEC